MFRLHLNPNQEVFRYDINVEMVIAGDRGRGNKVISMSRGAKDELEFLLLPLTNMEISLRYIPVRF